MTPTEAPPRYHVLLIGIDRYPDEPLQGCVNDVEVFEQLLQTALGGPPTTSVKLVAPHGVRPEAPLPTRDCILAALRDLAGEMVHPNDRVFIYYAGHGTRRYFAQAESNHEAIIPVDYAGDPARLVFNFELSPLLQAIARRSQDLTIILDCCNSAGIPRQLDEELESQIFLRPRGMANLDDPAKPLPSPPADAARELLAGGDELLSHCAILAAAQANETAAELDQTAELGGPRGALSLALMQILREQFRDKLRELRWAELWTALGVQLNQLGAQQHPDLIGSLGRRVFGGPASAFEPGLPVRALPDGTFEVGGGELAGLGPGAVVALYGPELPAKFAPLGTQIDQADRIGLLFISRVDSLRAIGSRAPDTMLVIPKGTRGRLACLGSLGRLRVTCRAGVADWLVQTIVAGAAEDGTQLLLAGQVAADSEVYIDQGRDGTIYLGDAVYSTDPGVSPGPLATIAEPTHIDGEAERRAQLGDCVRAALRHYGGYCIPLRLAARAQRQGSALRPSSIKFIAVDARDPIAIKAMQHDAGQISELPQNELGRYPVASGDALCFRIHNRSWSTLYVTLVHCDSVGRVRLLTPMQQIAPSTGAFLWPSGIEVGIPFRFELSSVSLRIERIFAIATDSPDVDFQWLAQGNTLQDAAALSAVELMDERSNADERSDWEPPAIDWTAARLQLEIRAR